MTDDECDAIDREIENIVDITNLRELTRALIRAGERAGIAAERARHALVIAAADAMRNEFQGLIGAFPGALAEITGFTNLGCYERRLQAFDAARAALNKDD